MKRPHPLAVLLTLAAAASACGDDTSSTTPDAAMPPADAGPSLLDPPPTGQGVQYQMIGRIEPGEEVEQCRFVQAPAEGLWINRDEVRFASGSHHFLLYATSYTTIPTQNDEGVAIDTSKVFDCSNGATDGWSVVKLVGGSQNGSGDSMLRFPAGVAVHVPGNTVLLMNAHYINTTDGLLEPEARINLWTIAEAAVETEGDILFLYNPLIKVKANGTSRARWRCPVLSDITVANVQSHMHRRGVGYEASVVGQAAPFYASTEWEDVPVAKFEPGMQLHAGDVLDYHCDYANPENRDVYQGPRSKDEMCMLIGSYYPADFATAGCVDAQGRLNGEWVGNGTKSCAETLGCVQTGLGAGGGLEAVTDCMDVADPAVAKESSASVNCMFNLGENEDPAIVCKTHFDACLEK